MMRRWNCYNEKHKGIEVRIHEDINFELIIDFPVESLSRWTIYFIILNGQKSLLR
jgi:hypothetical protein